MSWTHIFTPRPQIPFAGMISRGGDSLLSICVYHRDTLHTIFQTARKWSARMPEGEDLWIIIAALIEFHAGADARKAISIAQIDDRDFRFGWRCVIFRAQQQPYTNKSNYTSRFFAAPAAHSRNGECCGTLAMCQVQPFGIHFTPGFRKISFAVTLSTECVCVSYQNLPIHLFRPRLTATTKYDPELFNIAKTVAVDLCAKLTWKDRKKIYMSMSHIYFIQFQNWYCFQKFNKISLLYSISWILLEFDELERVRKFPEWIITNLIEIFYLNE